MAATATPVVLDTPAAEFRLPATDGKSLKVTGQVKVTGGPDGIRTAGR